MIHTALRILWCRDCRTSVLFFSHTS